MRVYELSKEYGKVSTEFLDVIQSYGIDVKSHLASLTDDQIAIIRQRMEEVEDDPEIKEWVSSPYPPDVVEPPYAVKPAEIAEINESVNNLLEETAEKTKRLADETQQTAERLKERREERISIQQAELEKKAEEVKEKLQEVKEQQWAEIDKPKGFFGWLASLFT